MLRRSLIVAATSAAGLACAAHAQLDPGHWPSFKGTGTKRASLNLVSGPAVNHAFTKAALATVSPGGFSVAANGDVYFKSINNTAGSFVYRLNPANGNVLAQSPDLGGGAGNYAGVALGVDAAYTCIHGGVSAPAVVKLNKTTLAIINTFTNPAYLGLRGTPLISPTLNNAGNRNLYVHDRNAKMIHAVDSVTGDLKWSYNGLLYDTFFGQIGPMWTLNDGRPAVACFENGDLGPGHAIADNGDSTYQILWSLTGPESFNWWGSGALSADSQRIYVTTFNDGGADSLWAINVLDGSVAWSMPGGFGTSETFNYFARPAVLGNRIYCGGGDGVIACYVDNQTSATLAWAYRDTVGEHTAISAARTDGGEIFVYAVKQEGPASLIVLRDDGASYTPVLNTTVAGAMRNTLFGNNSATVDAQGDLWVAGGRHDDPGPGDVYKFSIDAVCYPDCNNSATLTIADFSCFQAAFVANAPYADCNGSGTWTIADFACFQAAFVGGCP